jgi:hypothetical protein
MPGGEECFKLELVVRPGIQVNAADHPKSENDDRPIKTNTAI